MAAAQTLTISQVIFGGWVAFEMAQQAKQQGGRSRSGHHRYARRLRNCRQSALRHMGQIKRGSFVSYAGGRAQRRRSPH